MLSRRLRRGPRGRDLPGAGGYRRSSRSSDWPLETYERSLGIRPQRWSTVRSMPGPWPSSPRPVARSSRSRACPSASSSWMANGTPYRTVACTAAGQCAMDRWRTAVADLPLARLPVQSGHRRSCCWTQHRNPAAATRWTVRAMAGHRARAGARTRPGGDLSGRTSSPGPRPKSLRSAAWPPTSSSSPTSSQGQIKLVSVQWTHERGRLSTWTGPSTPPRTNVPTPTAR